MRRNLAKALLANFVGFGETWALMTLFGFSPPQLIPPLILAFFMIPVTNYLVFRIIDRSID